MVNAVVINERTNIKALSGGNMRCLSMNSSVSQSRKSIGTWSMGYHYALTFCGEYQQKKKRKSLDKPIYLLENHTHGYTEESILTVELCVCEQLAAVRWCTEANILKTGETRTRER